MKLKSKIKIFQMIFLVVSIVFSSLFISACQKTDAKILTPDNYSKYLVVTSSARIFGMFDCNVSIKKVSGTSSFQNVAIKYKFNIYDAEHTLEQEFTEYLGDFKNDYSKSFQLRFDRTNGNFPHGYYTSVEVLEISGTCLFTSGHSGEEILSYIGIGFLFVLVFGILLFFPIRAYIFSGKFNNITNGMKYEEVINILGEPRESSSAKGIKTCIWKRAILRGWTKTYILTFKDGEVILDMAHSNWS